MMLARPLLRASCTAPHGRLYCFAQQGNAYDKDLAGVRRSRLFCSSPPSADANQHVVFKDDNRGKFIALSTLAVGQGCFWAWYSTMAYLDLGLIDMPIVSLCLPVLGGY